MPTIDPTDNPADLIDHAHGMIHFLATMMAESRANLTWNQQDVEGFCYILSHIEDHLKEALTRL